MNKEIDTVRSEIVEEAFKMSGIHSDEEFQKKFPFMTLDEKIKELSMPRVLKNIEGEISQLFLRYVESGVPIVQAVFFPQLAAGHFYETAKRIIQDHYDLNEKELNDNCRTEAAIMLSKLFRNLYSRLGILFSQMIDEVVLNWQKDEMETLAKSSALEGVKPSRYKYQTRMNELMSLYNKEVKGLWNKEAEQGDNSIKMQLAMEYNKVINHWQKLHKDSRKNVDWREYGKAGKFFDTPDDLLDLLIDTDNKKISHLAIEHAARRVGLINSHNATESVREKWKRGILASGFSAQHLFELKKAGLSLLEKKRSGKFEKTSEQNA